MNNLFGLGILIEVKDDNVAEQVRKITKSLEDLQSEAEKTVRSVNRMSSQITMAGATLNSTVRSYESLGETFAKTSNYVNKLGDDVEKVSKTIGEDVPNNLKKAQAKIDELQAEIHKLNAMFKTLSGEPINSTLDAHNKLEGVFGKTYNSANKFERKMQQLAHQLGGEVPENLRKAYAEMFTLQDEVRRASRAYGKYSHQVMIARDNLAKWGLGLDDATFKQVYMRGQLGLTDHQLRQQANSIKLNARMTKLMIPQTEQLTLRMKGLQKAGVKPEDMMPPKTLGQFQLLNETIEASKSSIYKTTGAFRSLGNSMEKVIKNFSAQKVAIRMANGDMERYGLLLRGIGTGATNLGMALPVMGMGAFFLYKGLFSLAYSTNESLSELADVTKNKVLKAMQPLLDVVSKLLEKVMLLVGKVADWITKFNEAHPVVAKLISVILLLVPALTLLLSPLGFIPIGLRAFGVALNSLWTLIGPFVTAIGTASSLAIAFAVAITVLTTAFIKLWKTNDEFRNAITNTFNSIKEFGIKTFEKLKTTVLDVVNAFKEGGLEGGLQKISELFKTFVDNIISNAPLLINKGVEMFSKFTEGISQTLPPMIEKVSEVLGKIIDEIFKVLPKVFEVVSKILSKVVEGISKSLPKITELLVGIVQNIVQTLADRVSMFVEVGLMILKSLAEGILQALPEILEVVFELLNTVVTTILDNLPVIFDLGIQILQSLIEGVVANIPLIVDIATNIIETFTTFIIENLPKLIELGLNILTTLVNSILENLPKLTECALKIVVTIFEGIINNLPQIVMGAIQIVTTLATSIISNLPKIISCTIQLMSTIVSTIISNLPKVLSGAIQIVVSIASGIVQSLPKVVSAMGQIITGAINKIKGAIPNFLAVGGDIISGLAKGIANGIGKVTGAIGNVVKGAITKAKEMLGIHSPSRVFKQIGAWSSEGMALGVEQDSPKVNRAIEGMTDDAIDLTQDFQNIIMPKLSIGSTNNQSSTQSLQPTQQQKTEVVNNNQFTIEIKGEFNNPKDYARAIYEEIKRLQDLDATLNYN